MACDEQQKEFDDALHALDAAKEALYLAELNLESAQLWLASAMGGIILCGLTLAAGSAAIPGFIACELIAVSNEQAAERALQSATRGYQAAVKAENAASALAGKGLIHLCRCKNSLSSAVNADPDDDDDFDAELAEVEDAILEAESANDDYESDSDEAETLLAELEDAIEDIEDANEMSDAQVIA